MSSAAELQASIKLQMAVAYIKDLTACVEKVDDVWSRTGKGSYSAWYKFAEENLSDPDVKAHFFTKSTLLLNQLRALPSTHPA